MTSVQEFYHLLVIEKENINNINLERTQENPNMKLNINFEVQEQAEHLNLLLNKLSEVRFTCSSFYLQLEGDKLYQNEMFKQIGQILRLFQSAQNLVLDIGFSNNFTGENVSVLAKELQDFKNLSSLNLYIHSSNNFEASDMEVISQNLKHSKKLTNFNLWIEEGNSVGCKGLSAIADVVKGQQNLKDFKINFEDNLIESREGYAELGQAFKSITSLETLTLKIGGLNNLSSESAEQLFQGISNNTQIKNLQVFIGYQNQFGNQPAVSLGNLISQLEKLTNLGIQIQEGNTIGEDGSKSLLEGLNKCTQLQKLYLRFGGNIKIGDAGIQELGCSLEKLTFIEELILQVGQKNQLGNQGVESLFKGISKLAKLQNLIIQIDSDNLVGNEGIKALSLAIQNKTELKNLGISIYKGVNIGIDVSIEALEIVSKLLQCDKISLFVEEELTYIYRQSDSSALLQIKQTLPADSFTYFTNTIRFLNENLKNFKQEFKQSTLNRDVATLFNNLYEKNHKLQDLRINFDSSSKMSGKRLIELFQNVIQVQNSNYIEFCLEDGIKAIYTDSDKIKTKKQLSIIIFPYNKFGKRGCEALANLMKYLRNDIVSVTIFIQQDNLMSRQNLRIIALQLFKCRLLLNITIQAFDNQNNNGVEGQNYSKVNQLFKKLCNDRNKIAKTYLKFFQMVQKKYPGAVPKTFVQSIASKLPLMKEFQADVLLPNFANQYNFAYNNNVQLDLEGERFEDEFDLNQKQLVVYHHEDFEL